MPVDVAQEELRKKIQEVAKKHKASWIELGQYLYSIHKDKLYKSWGYTEFSTYCRKELRIRESTASKLLKSYFFLEKEEPSMASAPLSEDAPATIPHYESVNLLRLAKENKNLTTEDFADLRQAVLQTGKEPKEVRAQVKKILSEREDADPAEVRRNRRRATIKRLVSFLGSIKRELENGKLLPDYLLKQIQDLSVKLQDQLEED